MATLYAVRSPARWRWGVAAGRSAARKSGLRTGLRKRNLRTPAQTLAFQNGASGLETDQRRTKRSLAGLAFIRGRQPGIQPCMLLRGESA